MLKDFLDLSGPIEEDGRWFPLVEDQKEGPELYVRAVSTKERRQVNFRRFGEKRRIKTRAGTIYTTFTEQGKILEERVEIASLAWTRCRGLALKLSADIARELSDACGQPIAADEFVSMDDKIGKVETRLIIVRLMADRRPAFLARIEECEAELRKLEAEEEDELSKTSRPGSSSDGK